MELKQAILQTLCYSDIFEYPLSKNELWKFLIGSDQNYLSGRSKKKYQVLSSMYQEKITRIAKQVGSFKNGYFFLNGREDIVQRRMEKQKDNEKKIAIAKKVAVQLAQIPTVQFVGVSGAVAMKNAEKNDDIDLFIITKNNSLWFTRLFVTLLLDMQNLRRKRRQKKVANKICLNLFVDESSLAFGNQNLYKAHEISQVVPLFNKNQTYEKFICANKWILDFMPNSLEDLEFKIYDLRSYTHRHSGKRSASRISLDEKRSWTSQDDVWTYLLHPLEFLAKKIQLLIMQDKTSETVSDHVLAFHPLNYEEKILREYNKKISEYLT